MVALPASPICSLLAQTRAAPLGIDAHEGQMLCAKMRILKVVVCTMLGCLGGIMGPRLCQGSAMSSASAYRNMHHTHHTSKAPVG